MARSQIYILLAFAVSLSLGKDLPKSLRACRRSDPNLNQCFEHHANRAMKYISKGDPEYKIPGLLPLKFRDLLELEFQTNPKFNMKLTNVIVYGTENMKIVDAQIDLDAKLIQFTFLNPNISWHGGYEASVKVDHGDYEAKGPAQIDFLDGEFLMKIRYELKTINGVEHAEIVSHNCDFNSCRNDFHLHDLESNEVVHKHWKNAKEYFISEELITACSEIVTSYFKNIFKIVPFDKIFLP